MISVSISHLRNECYVYLDGNFLFQLNGSDTEENFSGMSEAEALEHVLKNYGDVVYDIAQ